MSSVRSDMPFSPVEERLRQLEDKIAELESQVGNYGLVRHASLTGGQLLGTQVGAQTEVTDTTDDQHPTQLANKDVIPEVRRCNFMQFKNRFSSDDARYAIDVLVSGDLLDKELHEELKFRKRRGDTAAAPASQSGKSKDKTPKLPHLSNVEALQEAQAQDSWIHRVRLQSPAILKISANAQGESWSFRPRTYVRPFGTLVYFQAQMKKSLEQLESRWASHLDGGVHSATPMTAPNVTTPNPNRSQMEEEEAPVDDCPEALAAMRCYVQFVDAEIMPQYTRFDNLTASDNPWILFTDLQYLFRTGELVYRHHGFGIQGTYGKSDSREWKRTGRRLWRCYGIRSQINGYHVRPSDHRKYDLQDGEERDEPFLVKAFYLEYTGEEFCTVTTEFTIPPFKGLQRIRSLPVFPVRFGPDNVAKYLADATALGDRTLEYIDLRHVSYDSWAVTRTPKGEPVCDANGMELKHAQYINSDVMVDFNEAFQEHPHWKPKRDILGPEPVNQLTETDDFPILWWSGPDRVKLKAESSEVVPVRTGVTVWEQNKFVSTDPLLSKMSENLAKGQLTTKEYLRNEDKALIACRVFGYVFQDRMFAQLDVTDMSPASGSRDALDSLRIPNQVKDLIQRSVQGHLLQKADERRHGHARGSQDFIRGKGAGLFSLLHGVPGVGKTATVEAIAQTHGKPLFKITCGDLGLTPEAVEASLGAIFRLADAWDCILLMDEVDTFFSHRSKGDGAVAKNALVSVFLRILDYYTGILFMTTNRVGALDEAFRSRIHYNILYPPLNRQQAREIWEINLGRLARLDAEHQRKTGRPAMHIPAAEILDFAERHFISGRGESAQWNGRQIRNAFQVARSLAYADAASAAERLRAGGSADETPPPPQLLVKHFELMDRVMVEFEDYMKEVFSGQTAADLARETEHRADGFTGRAWTTEQHDVREVGYDEGVFHGHGLSQRDGALSGRGSGRPSRGSRFRSGTAPRHSHGHGPLLEPPSASQWGAGPSSPRVVYPHSPTNNGPLPVHSLAEIGGGPPSPSRRGRIVTDNEAGWGQGHRPLSPGWESSDRVVLPSANKAGRTGVRDYVTGTHDDGEYEQDYEYEASRNVYGKRERGGGN